MSLNFQKTRLAPTPSGYLHLGNILSFVLTAGLARKTGASILLRIDDMDQERVRKEYLDDIFETLQFLELPWDEGPKNTADHLQHFAQTHRHKLYQDALQDLKQKELLFACSCSRSSLENNSNPSGYPGICLDKKISLNEQGVQWRLKIQKDTVVHLHDLVAGNMASILPQTMEYFQVRKKNGEPSYQLASLIDDLHFGIDLIVRGEDLRDSTLAQLTLAKALGKNNFLSTIFLHHPLLKANNEEKLSKSAGATSIHFLRKSGKNKHQILGLLAQSIGSQDEPHNWLEIYDLLEEKWCQIP